MTVTINVGYSEKLGQPDFGSIGASCHIECQLDGALLESPAEFQAKVRGLYAACATAAREELTRHGVGTQASAQNGSGRPSGKPADNGGSASHRASKRQLEYLEQLARQVPQVGTRRLESMAQRLCKKPLAELSSFEASSLIDTLKAIKEGKLDVEATVSEAKR